MQGEPIHRLGSVHFPQALYDRIVERARQNRRTVRQEIIVLLNLALATLADAGPNAGGTSSRSPGADR